MLYQEGISTSGSKQRVAVVVSHELAHQWFGNLVTPSWWTDLWLNEGFASYMEYIGMDAVSRLIDTGLHIVRNIRITITTLAISNQQFKKFDLENAKYLEYT